TEVSPHSQGRLSRMARHRDLAGEYDLIAVDCNRKGFPEPVFVKPEWPSTRTLGARFAEATQWMLDKQLRGIAAASGLGDTDDITNVLRNLPTSKLLTEDLETVKRRTRQVRGAPTLASPRRLELLAKHVRPSLSKVGVHLGLGGFVD
ncbi:MAG: hypothetical protein ACKPKO_21910, partial [Candidatus Fonsibacter sp.]